MKALVTGGAGFVGSNLCWALAGKGWDVVALDDFSNGTFKNLQGFPGDVVAADFGNVSYWSSRVGKIDAVFHQAAITDTTVMDQKKMLTVNVESFRDLLAWAAKSKVKKVVYASSAATYGDLPVPHREDATPKPLNVYGFSKAVMETVAQNAKGIKTAGLRYFNVFGPRESHKDKYASMIWQLSLQMKAGRRPRVFEHGEQYRDHIYVKDVVDANIKAYEKAPSGVYNCCTGRKTDFNAVIAALNTALGTSLAPEYFKNPYSFFQNETLGDPSKARKAFGFASSWTAERGIADYIGGVKTAVGEFYMASLRELRTKIKSVKSTEQITKAMKMVAAARMRKSQLAILAARPFATRMESMVRELALLQERDDAAAGLKISTLHPFFQKRAEGAELLVLVTGDKGLCGAFNSNVLRAGIDWFKARAGKKTYCIAVGRKGRDMVHRLRGHDIEVVSELVGIFPKISFTHADLLGAAVIDAFMTKGVSSVTVLYNEFKSVAQQRLLSDALLPIPAPAVVPDAVALPDYGFEPSRPELLAALLPRFIKAQAYRILLESQAAELAARMNAMDAASKNAKELREALNLSANRTRQAAITKEIAELVGGAEALAA